MCKTGLALDKINNNQYKGKKTIKPIKLYLYSYEKQVTIPITVYSFTNYVFL